MFLPSTFYRQPFGRSLSLHSTLSGGVLACQRRIGTDAPGLAFRLILPHVVWHRTSKPGTKVFFDCIKTIIEYTVSDAGQVRYTKIQKEMARTTDMKSNNLQKPA